ncbi:MAG: hypothetical protein KJ970_01460 [Candidatus Eisenbacteria bacterium]|uniref:Uncharacterized protein n=1 Tax=Eiseniibacteriota bacterium TaxID=2212470 RepID=A0A948RRC4_UNCEI|nr:hypothetical protein [Candidatus Eisenbacteria bacterium]
MALAAGGMAFETGGVKTGAEILIVVNRTTGSAADFPFHTGNLVVDRIDRVAGDTRVAISVATGRDWILRWIPDDALVRLFLRATGRTAVALDTTDSPMNGGKERITIGTLNNNLLPRFQRGDFAASPFARWFFA